MKKNVFIVIAVFILGFLALYFNKNRSSGTLNKELKNFAITDSSSITKIFLADKNGNTVTLTKKTPGNWIVDGKMPAREDAIVTLLYTMQAIDVRSPVGKNAYNTIMKSISANGIKVEIYTGETKIKTYYVGSHNQDMLGTYMYLEGSNVPFVVHIPGFNGYLTPRYNPRADEWIYRNVFAYDRDEIKNLTMQNFEDPSKSFEITKVNENSYLVSNPITAERINEPNLIKINSYFSMYKTINYTDKEKFPDRLLKDSILQAGPFRIISIVDREGAENKVFLYRKPITKSSISKEDAEGNPRKYDIDYLYGKLNNDTFMVRMQYYSFDPLLSVEFSSFQ